MDSFLLDIDPITGHEQTLHVDDEQIVVSEEQDVTDIIDQNVAEYASVDERARFGEMRKIASIPMSVFFELQRKGVLTHNGQPTDQAAFAKWLNDRDNLRFRTRPGTV
jgi:hypothetical protein